MRKLNLKKAFVSFFLLTGSLASLSAQPAADRVEAHTTVDWQEARITVSVSAPLPGEVNVIPEAKNRARDAINEVLDVVLQTAMEPILLNSQTTVSDRLKKHLELTSVIRGFNRLDYQTQTVLTPDLRRLTVEYQIPLYPDFCRPFVTHRQAKAVPRKLSYTPARAFTGIVIYAAEALPVFGEKLTSEYHPCLFPKIYSDSGKLVFSPEQMDPALLIQQGAVHFVDSMEKVPPEYAGDRPMLIKATALFGQNRTDLVIPSYLADPILYRADNRALLQKGRITVVCNSKSILSSLSFTP